MTSRVEKIGAAIAAFVCALTATTAWGAEAPCITLTQGKRVENARDVEALKNVCEVRGGLGIFTEGIREITLPRLRSLHLVNIEADDLEAINFPALTEASYIYISGGDLTVAELPRLKHVGYTLHVKSKSLKYLHLPSLRKVGKLFIERNPNLEFVFVDKLYDVGRLSVEGNPRLAEGTVEVLEGVTRIVSAEEQAFVARAQQEIYELKRRFMERADPPLPPTGHRTEFGTIGFYYGNYPWAYWNYWNHLRPYGYRRWYRGIFGWI